MQWQVWVGLTAVFLFMMLVVQRSEPKRRRFSLVIMLIGAEITRRTIVYRGWHREGLWSVITAGVLLFIFWFLIGRYNPPASSEDEIEVIEN